MFLYTWLLKDIINILKLYSKKKKNFSTYREVIFGLFVINLNIVITLYFTFKESSLPSSQGYHVTCDVCSPAVS